MNQLPPHPGRKRRHPKAVEANRPHQWGGGPNSPDWLNGDNGQKTCRACGVSVRNNLILADHAGFGDDGKTFGDPSNRVETFTYEDAKGNTFTSQKPLGCPVFILDHMGTTMENRAMLREHDDRMDHSDDRVDSMEARVARLETENEALKTRLAERVDVTALVDWLSDMVALHAAQKLKTVDIQIEGRTVAALPPPVANLIIDMGNMQKQPEPVRVVNSTRPSR